MNQLMKDLYREHKGLKKLLEFLQVKLHMLEKDLPIKYRLIEDTLDYIENYLNIYHHPKEDIIYNYIIEHGLDTKEYFAKTVKEHIQIGYIVEPLNATLRSILLDIITPKEVTIEQLSNFIQAQQAHLQYEESLIFPLAEAILDEKDWAIIEQSVPVQINDPLFGENVRAEYEDLYHRLREIDDR